MTTADAYPHVSVNAYNYLQLAMTLYNAHKNARAKVIDLGFFNTVFPLLAGGAG
jgi:hypothetical protein